MRIPRLPEEVRGGLRLQWFFYLAQLVAIAVIIRWWNNLPVPGYAIGVLAVAAAVMSVHGRMRWWQKVTWMLIIGAFLFLEFRAIDKDRKLFADDQAMQRDKEQDRFKRLLNNQNDNFNKMLTQAQADFSATICSAPL